MVKNWFAVGVALLLMSVLVAGCGMPQEKHDTVVAEADAVKAQIPSLESELATTESEMATVESDLAATESELATAKSNLESAQSELASAESQASSAESQLSSLRSQVSSLKSDIAAAESGLTTAQETITELEEAIAAAEEAAAAAAAAAEEEEEVEEIPPLAIGGTQLCSKITPDGKCRRQPDDTFERGDTVYFYFQVFDITCKVQSDGRYKAWVTTSGHLYGPDGKEIPDTELNGWYFKTDLEYPIPYVYSIMNYESKADDEPGEYRFEFIVTDRQSFAKGTASGTFTLE